MSKQKTRVLTGITPSGTPHLGNYVGAIRPAIEASRADDVQNFYFLADYHALIKTGGDADRIQRATLEIAATWLACGLDPNKVHFYRQSDIPETLELTWFLTCVAGKGILNRAHAYKAAVDKNREEGEDDDAGITAGLFMYPVLMAADILLFNANEVPVGRDQIQHIEMARDFAQRFNHIYGHEYFVMPEVRIDEAVATLAGLDGRKMSKSYNNTIPLFSSSNELKKLIAGIVTDSKAPGEAKTTEGSAVFQLYQAFASEAETAQMRTAYAEGIGWGEAKQRLFERVEQDVAPLRERYHELMAKPQAIEEILKAGAKLLQEQYAMPLLRELRHAVGLRPLSASTSSTAKLKKIDTAQQPALFKQYRERDGRFYFKLVRGENVLLQSKGFESPKDAGQNIAALKQGKLALDDAQLDIPTHVSSEDIMQALAELHALEEARK